MKKRLGLTRHWGLTLVLWPQKKEQTLAANGFIGHIDINTIVNGNGIYPLEFTSRFGYPQLHIQLESITENFGQMLYKIAQGQDFQNAFHFGVFTDTRIFAKSG